MPQNQSLETPIGNTGVSIDPSKAARTALLVAQGMGRKTLDSGGNAGDPMYGGAQPTSQPGFEEWQTQTGGNIFPDSSNAVTGPTGGSDARDEVLNKYWNNVYKRRNVESTSGDEIKRGGRIKRDSGGNAGLKNAINSFSQQRNAEFNTSPASAQQEQMLLASLMNQPRELAVAEAPRESQQPPAMNTYGDLGDQIERGAKFLEGTPDEDTAPVKGQPSKGAVVNGATQKSDTPSLSSQGQNAAAIHMMNRLVSVHGWTPAAAAIAAGNAMQESGFNPNAIGDNGISHGYGQWNHDRFANLQQFAKDRNVPWNNPDTQIDFMASEAANKLPDWQNQQDLSNARSISKAYEGYGIEGTRVADAHKFLSMYPGSNQPVQSADTSDYAPPSMGRPDTQGIIKDPNSDGSFTLRDQNGNTVGYDRGNASLDSVPYSQPHIASPNSGPPMPPPRPPDPSPQGEGASGGPQAQADPMSDTYNRIAFAPDVQAGYDNPQVMFDPNAAPSAARGGYMRRAEGGFVARERGQKIGAEGISKIRRLGHVYRGMTHDEYSTTIGAGRGIKSTNKHSLKGEGTNFAEDPESAESYVNFGRDDPRITGKPTYLVEAKSDGMTRKPDGYYHTNNEVAPTRTWAMHPEDDSIVARPHPVRRQASNGGLLSSMPTNELIAKALDIIRRRHAATGGTQAAPTLQSLQSNYNTLSQQQAQEQAQEQRVNDQLRMQATNQMINIEQNGGRGGLQAPNGEDPLGMLGATIGGGPRAAAIRPNSSSGHTEYARSSLRSGWQSGNPNRQWNQHAPSRQ